MQIVPLAAAGPVAVPAALPAEAPAAAESGAILDDVVKVVGAVRVVVADEGERGNRFRRAAPDTEVAGQREWKPRPRDRQETSSNVASKSLIVFLWVPYTALLCTALV